MKREGNFRLLLDSAAEGIYEIDTDGNCIFCNKAALRMLGYADSSEVIGRNMHDLIHHSHEDGTPFPVKDCKIFQAFTDGTENHVDDEVLWTREGKNFPAEYWSYPIIKQGKTIGSVVTFLDISERRNIERALRTNEFHLKGIIEGTNVGTWDWNVQTGEAVFNERWAKIVGYTLAELAPVSIQTWIDLAYPPDLKKSDEELGKVFRHEQPFYDFECRMKHRNGELVWVHDRGKVIEWTQDGLPLRMTGTHSDITARKQMEMALQESEARLRELNATKDKFFSIIAHDLKTPFTAVIGFSDVLLERVRSKEYERIEEFASIIQNSSKQALNLLSNLLEWSRSQTGRMELKLENTEIVALINEIVNLFQETAIQKSITITKNLPDQTFLMADKKMIATVIRNLISNAIKFTYPGGGITISIKQNKDELIVEVKDNGTGISKENIDNLFRMDVNDSTLGTQNEKGTGLGLLLCNEFIQKHGGRIWVKSKTGTGSTFSFSIPSILP
ncbi:MAG: PAS domain-containing sensor histidine kinase [Bacteroidetes bacterium]|nr:PAS domain-containing sensor histidine kinase [Bacteroidota bacterium]